MAQRRQRGVRRPFQGKTQFHKIRFAEFEDDEARPRRLTIPRRNEPLISPLRPLHPIRPIRVTSAAQHQSGSTAGACAERELPGQKCSEDGTVDTLRRESVGHAMSKQKDRL